MHYYNILITEAALAKVNDYLERLKLGQSLPGKNLAEVLQRRKLFLENISYENFLRALLDTKKLTVDIEDLSEGGIAGWNYDELTILNGMVISAQVVAYDNALPRSGMSIMPDYVNSSSRVEPIPAHLLFIPCDYAIPNTPDGMLASNSLPLALEQRLLQAFLEINYLATQKGKEACVTVPALGCRKDKDQSAIVLKALQHVLKKYALFFSYIKLIYFDPYPYYGVDPENGGRLGENNYQYGAVELRVRELRHNNFLTPQLAPPSGQYELYSLVDWSGVLWPGGILLAGNSGIIPDNIKSRVTDIMQVVTGIQGVYNKEAGEYRPLSESGDWQQLITQRIITRQRINLSARGKFFCYRAGTKHLLEGDQLLKAGELDGEKLKIFRTHYEGLRQQQFFPLLRSNWVKSIAKLSDKQASQEIRLRATKKPHSRTAQALALVPSIYRNPLVQAFKVIYARLRNVTLYSYFRTNWLIKLEGKSDTEALKMIQLHAKEKPESRTAIAWGLAQKYYQNFSEKNEELTSEILRLTLQTPPPPSPSLPLQQFTASSGKKLENEIFMHHNLSENDIIITS